MYSITSFRHFLQVLLLKQFLQLRQPSSRVLFPCSCSVVICCPFFLEELRGVDVCKMQENSREGGGGGVLLAFLQHFADSYHSEFLNNSALLRHMQSVLLAVLNVPCAQWQPCLKAHPDNRVKLQRSSITTHQTRCSHLRPSDLDVYILDFLKHCSSMQMTPHQKTSNCLLF